MAKRKATKKKQKAKVSQVPKKTKKKNVQRKNVRSIEKNLKQEEVKEIVEASPELEIEETSPEIPEVILDEPTEKEITSPDENENIVMENQIDKKVEETPVIEESAEDKKEEVEVKQQLTVPILSIGSPGVGPIPDAGMNHNVKNQPDFMNVPEASKNLKKSNRKMSVAIFLIIIIVIALTIGYFLLTKEKKEIETPDSNIEETNQNTNSNSTSNEKDPVLETTKVLVCTLPSKYAEGVDGFSKSTYTFEHEKLIKIEDEEFILFDEEGLQFYDVYKDQVKAEMDDASYMYDNTTLMMIKKKNRIGLIYTIDLTADSANPNNNLDMANTTYEKAKEEFLYEGYTCE